MKHLIHKLTRHGFNERVFDQLTTEQWIESMGVKLFFTDQIDDQGMYMVYGSHPCILVKSSLTGLQRNRVCLHEAIHHVFHTPETCTYYPQSLSKIETEAESGVLIGLMPRWLMETRSAAEIHEEYGYPVTLQQERRDLYYLHGV